MAEETPTYAALKKQFRKVRGLPLRTTYVGFAVAIVLLTALVIGGISFIRAREIVFSLWERIAVRRGTIIQEQIKGHFAPAKPWVSEAFYLMQKRALDLRNPQVLKDYFSHVLELNPQIQGFTFIRSDGSTVVAFRSGADSLQTLETSLDPEKEPVYEEAKRAKGEGIWTYPHSFQSPWLSGMAINYAQFVEIDQNLEGVLLAEFKTEELTQFLKEIKFFENDHIYLVTEGGEVLAESDRELAAPLPIADTTDPLLKEAWRVKKEKNSPTEVLLLPGYFGYYNRLSGDFPWYFFLFVNQAQRYAIIDKMTLHTFFVSLAIVLFIALITGWGFGKLSRRLKDVAFEMYLLTQFHFSQKDLAKATSLLQEVNVMNLSLDHMKEGLKTFSKYLPIDLVSNLIKTGQSEALGGSKREITILFVDIKAFTPLAEELPASQIFDYLFQYFTEMGRVIEEEQGVIDKYLGDGFMAFFGAPESLLEHPNHACRAALKMKKALQKLQLQWVQQGKKPLDHRIGINTGTVLVGNFGSLARMEYTAIGDVVNTASRLEELNKSYGTEVILGETTARRVEEEFLVRPLDWTTVKGKKQPLPIYELICSKQEASSRLREAVTAYREGLELYHKADYPAALEKFVAAEALFERVDSPTRLFIAKCRSHLVI